MVSQKLQPISLTFVLCAGLEGYSLDYFIEMRDDADCFIFQEGQVVVDNTGKSYGQVIMQATFDIFSLWYGKSGLKTWLRI